MSALDSFFAHYSARSFHRPESVVRLAYHSVLSTLGQFPSVSPPVTLVDAPVVWKNWFDAMDYVFERFTALFCNPKNFRRLRYYTGSDLSDGDYAALHVWSSLSSQAKSYPESFFPSVDDAGTHRPSPSPGPFVAPPFLSRPPPSLGFGPGSSVLPTPSVPSASIKRRRGLVRVRASGRPKAKGVCGEDVLTSDFITSARRASHALAALAAHPYLTRLALSERRLVPSASLPVSPEYEAASIIDV